MKHALKLEKFDFADITRALLLLRDNNYALRKTSLAVR